MDQKLKIISLQVNNISFGECLERVSNLGFTRTPSFVCFVNAHMVIEAWNSKLFLQQLNTATLILADGKPVAKACYWLYKKKQDRIAGMDFLPALLNYLDNKKDARLFLLGSAKLVLDSIKEKINSSFINIQIAGAVSPPFRALTNDEQQQLTEQINTSGANFVLVALGCPKQEKWMAEHYKKINAVLLGVGGAFPVFAGIQKRSPQWMQTYGLEWLYRLLQEPRRLLKRYLVTNTIFLFLFLKQWLSLYSGKNETA
ncbi:MAG: WecB/TagA/CpsF family glycosyltransferase [Chitinophagaceae bacterium]|nr:WecB/TagA/CpsF family glycosyltransferase [Chitinophagaceae bacterium]